MKTIEKLKVKITYDKDVGGQTKTKSKSYSNLKVDATDENILKCGQLIGSLIDGYDRNYFRIEEAHLGEDE